MWKREQFHWDAKAVQYLKDNYATKSANEIAATIGTSRNSVIGKANRLGLKFSKGATYMGATGYVAVARLMADEKDFIAHWDSYGFTSPSQAALMQQKIIDDMGWQAV